MVHSISQHSATWWSDQKLTGWGRWGGGAYSSEQSPLLVEHLWNFGGACLSAAMQVIVFSMCTHETSAWFSLHLKE